MADPDSESRHRSFPDQVADGADQGVATDASNSQRASRRDCASKFGANWWLEHDPVVAADKFRAAIVKQNINVLEEGIITDHHRLNRVDIAANSKKRSSVIVRLAAAVCIVSAAEKNILSSDFVWFKNSPGLHL